MTNTNLVSLPTKFEFRPPSLAILEVMTPTALKVYVFLLLRGDNERLCTIEEIHHHTQLAQGTISKALRELLALQLIDYEECRSPLGYREGFLFKLLEPTYQGGIPESATTYYRKELNRRQEGIDSKRKRLNKLSLPYGES